MFRAIHPLQGLPSVVVLRQTWADPPPPTRESLFAIQSYFHPLGEKVFASHWWRAKKKKIIMPSAAMVFRKMKLKCLMSEHPPLLHVVLPIQLPLILLIARGTFYLTYLMSRRLSDRRSLLNSGPWHQSCTTRANTSSVYSGSFERVCQSWSWFLLRWTVNFFSWWQMFFRFCRNIFLWFFFNKI